MNPDETFEKAMQEIIYRHNEIIDDWCKAYCAELYKKNGSINPGDFMLNQQMTANGWKYWFTKKEEE